MKSVFLLFILLIAVIKVNAQAGVSKNKQVVDQFEQLYKNDDAEGIYMLMADAMKQALPLANTKQAIGQIKTLMGNLITTDYAGPLQGMDVYKIHGEKKGFIMVLAITADNKIGHLQVLPDAVKKDAADTVLSPNNISLKVTGGTLYGTLTVPIGTKKVPIILFIAGSGPTDRNNNSPSLGLQSNGFLMLAKILKDNGIATLRYDKRFSGQSVITTGEIDVRYDDYINDAIQFIELLKKDPRFSKVIVLGHSEGSLVGMIAVSREKTDGFISVAGAGTSLDIILKRQLKSLLPTADFKTAAEILDSLKNGHTVNYVPQSLALYFHKEVQPFLISDIKYNPVIEIRQVTVPVLLIQGTTDLQVQVEDAELLKKAYPKATLNLINGMNHVLKPAPIDANANKATYNNPDLPLHPDLAPSIISFVNGLK